MRDRSKRSAVSGSEAAAPQCTPLPGGGPIRILLAEDHAVVRDGLIAIINQEPDMQVVADVGNGNEAVEQWRRSRPDVTLMDMRMPALDGVAAISEIRAIEPNARIIILTTYDGDEDIYRGIRAGASSYLLKDVSRQDLFECIRHVHAGHAFFPTTMAARIVKLTERSRGDALTSRESDVLGLLAEGHSNKAIASKLSISDVTVKSHVQSILRKLRVLSRTEAIAVAHRSGLLRH